MVQDSVRAEHTRPEIKGKNRLYVAFDKFFNSFTVLKDHEVGMARIVIPGTALQVHYFGTRPRIAEPGDDDLA